MFASTIDSGVYANSAEEEAFVSTAECGATAKTAAEAASVFTTGSEAIAGCVVALVNASMVFGESTARFVMVLAIVGAVNRSPSVFRAVKTRK